jgi:hypothetical protein
MPDEFCPRCGTPRDNGLRLCGGCGLDLEQIDAVATQLQHAHGCAMVEGNEVVNHLVGKNLLTRKEWQKDERSGTSGIRRVVVQSRDRRTFAFDATDGGGKTVLHVEGCTSKSQLDAFLGELRASCPDAAFELAHPSYRLLDPVHEEAVQRAKSAVKFNEEEQKRRKAAMAQWPEAKVKTYDNHQDYAKDAPKMIRDGWTPAQEVSDKGKVSIAGTVGKTVVTGGLGLITGLSHKGNKLTVTWVKQPKAYVPQEFVPVPPVPAPRVFPHEPYFNARNIAPVDPGREYPPALDRRAV